MPKSFIRTLIPQRPTQVGYISVTETVTAAAKAGLSVCDYVERLWGQQGNTAAVISRMPWNVDTVVEIGPGTGRYIDHWLRQHHRAKRYQIYETHRGWAEWLAKTYPVENCQTDGEHLSTTECCDLVHAHGVFVYVPFLVACSYFREIERVAPTYVVFDILSERCLDHPTVGAWLKSKHRYPCFLSRDYVLRALPNFRLIDAFTMPYGEGRSEYLILRRD